MAKKYVSLSKLSIFLDNLKKEFAKITHTHTISDISDYTVDNALSSTSTNPVQNKILDAEFDAIADAMGALETAIDINRTHWVESFSGEVLPLTQIQPENYNEDMGAFVVNGVELVLGGEYTVNWNGYEHTCVATSLVLENVEFIVIGNSGVIGGTGDNGLPFAIMFSELMGDFLMIIPLDEAIPLVSISGTYEKVHKLDNKFLKIGELIKNTNIENGSAVDSLRGTGTAQEDDEYSIGSFAFAQGYNTKASGRSSHAEGGTTEASGICSHSEGNETIASGESSHAEGYGTKASGDYQHVQGKFNIEDTAEAYVHIVGNGDADARSNAHTLDWDGNAWFQGDVFVGGTSQDDGDRLVKYSELSNIDLSTAELITVADIDAICGTVIYTASEVEF